MPSTYLRLILLVSCSVTAWVTALFGAEPTAQREHLLLDRGWRFALGHATDPVKDFNHATGYFSYLAKTGFGDGPASPAFDDRTWRSINLPHDWAVELPFDPTASASHGYHTVGPRFPQNSVGWYRRTFAVPDSDLGRRIHLELDGAFRDARVFVNGFFVGQEPSGYLGVSYDLSEYLNYGGENVIAVRVDASMEEGWFYEGAGIYRHVWLSKTNPLHVARHGTFVRTDRCDEASATVSATTTVLNESTGTMTFMLSQSIVTADGTELAHRDSPSFTLAAGLSAPHDESFSIAHPALWSLESPVLHRLVTEVRVNGDVIDRYETPFGVRTIHFDPNAGFFLNGKHVVLKGTNNHQDHAGVGIAIPDALQEFRLRQLKAMGSNAYRVSHHPATPELLDACDRLGMLVIDENRLMGINPYHLGQLEAMIQRDRNHPSVILWSIGNEEWAIEGNPLGARITLPMQALAHRLDPTRSVTAAISGGWGGISTTIEAAGVNYIKQGDPDHQHALFPTQIILGTEETTTQGTRGIYRDDRGKAHLAPVEDGSSGGNAERGWKYYAQRPFTAGVFFWTGFDYRGEATPFTFPAVSSQFGLLDTCGFPKDSFYYLKSWWSNEPVLHLFPHWNWPGREGQPIEVTVNGNCEEVELFLNGQSLGRKTMERNGHLSWLVNYSPGSLVAHGYAAGKHVSNTRVETTEKGAAIVLIPDRKAFEFPAHDLAVVAVQLQDAQGRLVPIAAGDVAFSLRGPARILGVGNGDPSSLEPDQFIETIRGLPIGSWEAPDPAIKTGSLTWTATFDRPALRATETVELLLNALGTHQTATLNGVTLYRDADPAQARATLAVELKTLRPSGNELKIEATRFENWQRRESLRQLHPAAFRISTPAPGWHRSAFNGLAQIIIQSTGEPGEVVVEASSAGLTSATLSFENKPVR